MLHIWSTPEDRKPLRLVARYTNDPIWDVPKHLRVRSPQYDQIAEQVRKDDRAMLRGIALGVLAGLIVWPTVVAFCWLVLWWAR